MNLVAKAGSTTRSTLYGWRMRVHVAGGVGGEDDVSRKANVGGGAVAHGDVCGLADDLLRWAGGRELGGQAGELVGPCGIGEHAAQVPDGRLPQKEWSTNTEAPSHRGALSCRTWRVKVQPLALPSWMKRIW